MRLLRQTTTARLLGLQCATAAFFLLIPADEAPGSRSVLPGTVESGKTGIEKTYIPQLPVADDFLYITINVAAGRIALRTADSVLLEAPCSAGSGAKFRDPATSRVWDFSTPNGIFTVRRKAENPIWNKPDWAYLEKGESLPENPADRLATAELGGYALDLGNGVYIHGTLYARLLGMNVTHGCIRVGDDALTAMYQAVEIGTPVYIFNSDAASSAETVVEQHVELDFSTGIARYRMNDVVVWEGSFTIKSGTGFSGSGTVEMRHCYSGAGQYAEYELAAMADELSAAPEHFQRIFPGRFALLLDEGIVLEVNTDLDGINSPHFDNMCFDVLRLINAPLGEQAQQLAMNTNDALTLYGLARPGLRIAADSNSH